MRLDPRWHQAALRFVESGFLHILEGIDHLLFLLCLVIPFRRFGTLVLIVTSFTVAHSITLIAAAYGFGPDALWFPPLVETLIAISIVYMALENIVGSNVRRRWIIAFAFGLVHGFGFSFALRETLQFAGSHLLTCAAVVQPRRRTRPVARAGAAGSAAGFRVPAYPRRAHRHHHPLGADRPHRLALDAGARRAPEPVSRGRRFDAATLASAMRWLMAALILAALVWLLRARSGRKREDRLEDE